MPENKQKNREDLGGRLVGIEGGMKSGGEEPWGAGTTLPEASRRCCGARQKP
ncbi:hypothetical protein CXB51_006387 [Gossypium anomalum]|uniref:Uncharacterized protein n=1 Tax=Gossypium anomalum TaxID=47600 RepID=A0A8J6D8M9_9ROSI|nr:hypothetical protein CXB51_006387 [Gossypium anomalum]